MNELAVITPSEWTVMENHAKALVASGFLPNSVNTYQKTVAIMSLGRELGIGAWAALNGINVIQGKPTVSPQLMLAMINRSGQLEDMEISADPDGATVTMKRKGRTAHTETFTVKDAHALGLTGKDNYKKQAATMLKWRAVAACARVVFSDVILGLYTPDEMGADVVTDDQGNMTVIQSLPARNMDVETGEIVDAQPAPEIKIAEKPAAQPAPQDLGELDWTAREGEDGVSVLVTDTVEVRLARTGKPFLTFSDGKQAAHSFTRDPLRPYMTEEQLAPLAEVGKYPLGDSFKVLFITKAGSDGKQRNEVVRIEKLAQQQAAS